MAFFEETNILALNCRKAQEIYFELAENLRETSAHMHTVVLDAGYMLGEMVKKFELK